MVFGIVFLVLTVKRRYLGLDERAENLKDEIKFI